MFVRKSTRRYKGKTYTNYLLVESFRTEKGPRQRVLCSLGDLGARSREDWLKLARRVESALTGKEELLESGDPEVDEVVARARASGASAGGPPTPPPPGRGGQRSSPSEDGDLVRVHVDRVTTEDHRVAGPVHVGYQFWQRLGFDSILENAGLSARARTITCVMVLNRLVHPGSEHAMPDWIRSTALAELLDCDFESLADDALYRNLDRLHPRRETIEAALAERERTLFNLDQTFILYDLTSTYFEGLANGNPKAQRGYSRDHRPDCKQVVIALALGREGFPKCHEVFEGRTVDNQTVGEILDQLDRRVGLKPGQTVVVDRGMAYDDNLAEIRSRGLHYLVAARHPERNLWLAEFDDDIEGFEDVKRTPSPLNPAQKKSQIRVKLGRINDETYVMCHSTERIAKDRAIREKHEQRLLAELKQLEARGKAGKLVDELKVHQRIGRLKERYPRVARYYAMSFDAATHLFSYTLDEERRAKAEKLDGCYLLRTDREDITAPEAWETYTLLTRVESAFRAMKSPLAERPVFHQVERRVDTHIFLCILAYHLLVAIEKTLLDAGHNTSWATVREALKTHQVSTTVLPTDTGDVLRIRRASTPEPAHRELYRLLGIPPEVMAPKKTWSTPPAPETPRERQDAQL